MQLGFWQKTTVYCSTVIVALSGLFWFVVHDVLADEPGDLTRQLLTLHGVSAYALLVAIGTLLPIHVRLGWRRRRNLVTGLTVITLAAVLGVTALMLYYGDEDLQKPAKWLHLALGLIFFVLFPAHALVKSTKRQPSHDGPQAGAEPTAPIAPCPLENHPAEIQGASRSIPCGCP
jgi:hypothetical protein